MVKIYSKGIIIFSLAFSLAACGNNIDSEILPDDQTQEEFVGDQPDNESPTKLEDVVEVVPSVSQRQQILSKYSYLDPKHLVPTKALESAIIFYENNQSRIKNKNYISIINFSKSSKEKRFFIISMQTGEVWPIHVAHGKGSDSNHDGYAEKFSNQSGSNASSLGYYLAAEPYHGKYGLSLRMDGLSSTNSNARRRAVVIHGANYVKDSSVKQGRSWGCPAVPMNLRDKVVGYLKGGSLIYAVN